MLLSLLNDLLDLAKLESGYMAFGLQACSVHVLVALVVEEVQDQLTQHHLAMDFEPPPEPLSAMVDSHRFMQVIRNLLSNAIKFSPSGGRITIAMSPRASHLVITVRDQGVGIPEAELETIFDKFVQSSKTKTGAGGTGLGLAICREIMAAHQGRIWAANAPEGGAVFTVELPLTPGVQSESSGARG